MGKRKLKVTVRVQPTDGKSHSLLTTKHGPLFLAGTLSRARRKTTFADALPADHGATIELASPREFTRVWPEKGRLLYGDDLTLTVGLCGVDDGAGSYRVIEKLAVFHAVIEPLSTSKMSGWAHVTVRKPDLGSH